MKTPSVLSLLLFPFLFFSAPNCHAAHTAHDHGIIQLVIAPQKVQKKKRNWKERIGITFLQKRLKKRMEKLRLKSARTKQPSTRKDGELPTNPLAFVSAGLVPLGFLLFLLSVPYFTSLALIIGVLCSVGAIVTGILSIRQTKRHPKKYHYNNGWAIFGIILGAIAFGYLSAGIYILSGFIF